MLLLNGGFSSLINLSFSTRVHAAKNSREVQEGNVYIPYNPVSHKIHNSIFLKNVQMGNEWDTSNTSNAINYCNTLQSSTGSNESTKAKL